MAIEAELGLDGVNASGAEVHIARHAVMDVASAVSILNSVAMTADEVDDAVQAELDSEMIADGWDAVHAELDSEMIADGWDAAHAELDSEVDAEVHAELDSEMIVDGWDAVHAELDSAMIADELDAVHAELEGVLDSATAPLPTRMFPLAFLDQFYTGRILAAPSEMVQVFVNLVGQELDASGIEAITDSSSRPSVLVFEQPRHLQAFEKALRLLEKTLLDEIERSKTLPAVVSQEILFANSFPANYLAWNLQSISQIVEDQNDRHLVIPEGVAGHKLLDQERKRQFNELFKECFAVTCRKNGIVRLGKLSQKLLLDEAFRQAASAYRGKKKNKPDHILAKRLCNGELKRLADVSKARVKKEKELKKAAGGVGKLMPGKKMEKSAGGDVAKNLLVDATERELGTPAAKCARKTKA
jgi:hypothetical protein